jgi:hypothetical protein
MALPAKAPKTPIDNEETVVAVIRSARSAPNSAIQGSVKNVNEKRPIPNVTP